MTYKIGTNIYLFCVNFQAQKTEQNFVLTNLILIQLLISLVGVPFDTVGAATNASAVAVLCPFVTFIHTLFGKYIKTLMFYY